MTTDVELDYLLYKENTVNFKKMMHDRHNEKKEIKLTKTSVLEFLFLFRLVYATFLQSSVCFCSRSDGVLWVSRSIGSCWRFFEPYKILYMYIQPIIKYDDGDSRMYVCF